MMGNRRRHDEKSVRTRGYSAAARALSESFRCDRLAQQSIRFQEHYRYGEPLSGAQMRLGKAYIMVKSARPGPARPKQLGYGTQSLTIFVDDVDAHYRQAKAAHAKILEEPHVTVYTERQYAAEDLDGHHWLFSQHARDLSPEEWGARVVKR
jgi:uncharacterized glyoxalase superfamily protein PhnB